ncbi:hypothetical protein [Streptomyces sp. NPDC057854]|uniref:hypothetical protein n=1 Tax=unclassified Streptomyces TaxID=2593676 RepID=UPI00369E0510
MSERSDYGDSSRARNKLVPAALTAYRHFQMMLTPSTGARLTPMTGNDGYEREKVYVPGALAEEQEFHATCLPFVSPYGGALATRSTRHPYFKEHPTPSLECTCGFYAHYFPETDFYRDGQWALDEGTIDLTGVRFIVRAVVEVSGRVVAGDLGVRAEKMKIKALAVDWDKCIVQRPYPSPDAIGWRRGSLGYWRAEYSSRYRDIWPDHDRLIMDNAEGLLAHTAAKYAAKAYTSVADMYADHPQQDLSALGITAMTQDELAEKKRREAEEARKAREAQIAMYATDIAVDMKSLADVISSFTTGLSKISVDLSGTDASPTSSQAVARAQLDRLMEKKRNRPAPPGTGIDRRKRKL